MNPARVFDIPNSRDGLLKERLTALLLTVPRWGENYTATSDTAEWLIKEARRVGWEIELVIPTVTTMSDVGR